MKQIPEIEFIQLIGCKGIKVDSRYPESAGLHFENDPDIRRFWGIPIEARGIPFFLQTILGQLDPWEFVFVWKHMGSWKLKIEGERLNDDIQTVIYRGIGLQDDNADILGFNKKELPELIALIFIQLVFGWHVGDDLYIIPDHGKQMIKTSHHDVVHVSFREEETLRVFVNKMVEKGF